MHSWAIIIRASMDQLLAVATDKDCVVVAVFRGDRLLSGYRNYTADKWKDVSVWTLPGGRCEAGETLEAAVRRETREEVGVADLRITGFIATLPGAFEGDTLHVFAAETDEEPRNMEPEKFSEWGWKDPGEIRAEFINPAALEAILEYRLRMGGSPA